MTVRIGTDIIEISRIQAANANNERFKDRILSAQELEHFKTLAPVSQLNFLAGRFSAKEAYAKAMGTGIGRLKFSDITILPNDQGRPIILDGPIVKGAQVSISHCKEYATAVVLFELSEEVIEKQWHQFLAQKGME
ncbi:holo-[acyl-carrier-protein] synthase [Dolosicoccus paucivorans]|uniref:Holo-[acyl-carrier-protein] synthase n=1 Tax=Dolosicoccus paucivorans TaxID=84521 RepID=A0A2N6SMJ6_9LACT|nr:holo-ACP synthase [Dolosicoccus paucivorans]PMB84016.1 holo-[acyl-carrier-protein] synthase [Dolosicoccus paucivorans]PMC58280.1 holo-[acyl-carrier-protein] synthase [Dolosicoccus paucivorans]